MEGLVGRLVQGAGKFLGKFKKHSSNVTAFYRYFDDDDGGEQVVHDDMTEFVLKIICQSYASH